MAWNNDDWVWVADGPTGGIYRNKYNPELYADANGAVGTAETFGLGKSSGISYGPRLTDEDGSVTGIPGATYQMGSNGLPASVVRPSSGGSGGSSSPTNVYIQQNPGQLFQTLTVPEGGDSTGLPPGTVYQKNMVTGDFSILYKPPAAKADPASLYNDTNNDGYDDQTGLPVGVAKVDKSISPTGLVYQGKPVNADGSLYTGAGGSDLDLSNKVTTGGVTYVWSNSQNKYVPAPGLPLTSGPGSTPTGGGTYINSSSTARTASGGGGSYSAAASRDYAAEQAASDARQAQMAADARAWQAAQNDIDRQIRAQEFQANYGLNVAQFQAQQARDQAAQKSSDLRDFSNAISDTDMAKFEAVLYANGYNAGGTINNRLKEDPNAFFSELANVRAAGLLDQIRNGYGSIAAPGIPATGGLGTTGSAPAGAGTTGGAPSQPGATTGTLPSTQQNQGAGGGPTPPYITDATGTKVLNPAYVQEQAARREEENRQQAWATRTGWYPVSGPTGIVYTEYLNGQPTGKTMTQEQKARQDALDQFNPIEQSSVIANDQGAGAGYWIRPVIYDSLGQASGTSVQNVMPGAAGFTGYGPQQTETPYGNDNIQRAVDLGAAGGPTNEPTGTIQPRAVVAMAHGGGPVSGSLIIGDPQRPGVPNPELVTGDNIRVTPLNQMPAPVAGSLMQNTPKAAFGTEEVSPFSTIGAEDRQRARQAQMRTTTSFATPIASTAPTTQTTTPVATTAGSGTTTSPVAPTTPSTVSTPSTGTSPTSSAPATGSLTPTGQTVQQPTAPAPATGGLGSITDIVNGTATPTSQALLDEIAQWRQNVPLPNVDPLSLEFQRLDPLTQQSILQARQTRSYIPVAAQQYEINKYRIGGGRALAGSLAF